MIINIDN